MATHPLLRPWLSEEESLRSVLGDSYDHTLRYRLVSAKKAGLRASEGWWPIMEFGDFHVLMARPKAESELSPYPTDPPDGGSDAS